MSAATIGSALVKKRLELRLEKGQAADKIGMSRTTYSSYEQDAQRPSVDVFPALAGFLGVTIEQLLELYGATCVAAVRPALARVISGERNSVVGEERDDDSTLEADARLGAEVDAPRESLEAPSEHVDANEGLVTPEMIDEMVIGVDESVDEVAAESPRDGSKSDGASPTEGGVGTEEYGSISITPTGIGEIAEPQMIAESEKSVSPPLDQAVTELDSPHKDSDHKKKKKKKKKK